MLDRLHTHLAQLKRDGTLSSWTDQQIQAGERFNDSIARQLGSAQLFLALLSPDYIASNYCYEEEFQKALEYNAAGQLTIIPVILEPCEWQSTPFKEFKALPKDGKPISTWQNANTAFLDVIQNLRRLVQGVAENSSTPRQVAIDPVRQSPSRNYRVKKDFDSIQKMEFVEQSFAEITKTLVMYIEELREVDDQIKCRLTEQTDRAFEAILVNRNMIGAEATLQVQASPSDNRGGAYIVQASRNGKDIQYTIKADRRNDTKGFSLSFDEFHMFWTENSNYYNNQQKELVAKDIVDAIWKEWLGSVGIM